MQLTDARGQVLCFDQAFRRIVSLVPSQTEFLIEIGAEVIGRTRFCIHPAEQVAEIPIVGGTKDFKLDKIRALQPDLVIANQEENSAELLALATKMPVWTTLVSNLAEALQMMRNLGELSGCQLRAQQIVEQIEQNFEGLIAVESVRTCLYLIWRQPWMSIGYDTFIHDLLQRAGLQNVIKSTRYPQLSDTDLQILQPDVILLSSEPYPFAEKHIAELQQLCPTADIQLVDGELFSWYGSRLIKSAAYLQQLSQPESG